MRTRHRPAGAVALAAAMSILVAACGGGDGGGDDPDASGSPSTTAVPGGAAGPAPDGSAWGAVLDEIGDDGAVGKDTALQALALAFGDVPGVEVPDGPTGEVSSGSGALRWAVAVRDDLNADQRAFLDEILSVGGTPAAGPGKSRRRSTDGPGTSEYRTAVDEALARYKGPLGPLPIPTSVYLVPADGIAVAYAKAVDPQGDVTGSLAGCVIGITPGGQKLGPDGIAVTLAHEVFHCYEASWLGSLARYYSTEAAPPWTMEGAASWGAINSTASPIPDNLNFWSKYLVTPADSLFARSYDAVGFYGQVAQQGVDLWPLFKPFFEATDNEAAYHALADPAGDAFLDAWASGFWRAPDRGDDWDITGKAVTPRSEALPTPPALSIANAGGEEVSAKPYTNTIREISASSDLIHLAFSGHARLSDANGFDSTELSDLFLCTKEGGDCACPEESDGGGSDALPASRQSVGGTLMLALTGGPDGTQGRIDGMSLDDFCKKRNTTTTTAAGTRQIAPCELFTADDVTTLVGVSPSGPGVQVFGEQSTSMSGFCEYGPPNLGGAAASVAMSVLYRPAGAPVEQDWQMYAPTCPNPIAGVGTHAGYGTIPEGVTGCLLDGTALVTIAASSGSQDAMADVLRNIAARL